MKYMIPVCLLFIFLVSCENKAENNEQQVSPAALNPLLPSSNDSTGKSNAGAQLALNPKHGEPGHRCDIPEGAPLSSPVTNNNTQSNTSPSVTVPLNQENKTPTIPNTTTAGLNPKHGEPGHRCDIAVGAPLNSKPTQ